MPSINEAVRYPMERDDWVKTVLIGGGLIIFSFLVIPGILVSGYVIRVIRGRLEDAPEPPPFGEWGALLVDGLQAWIIGVIYMLVPTIVAAVTIGGSIASMATGSRAGAAAGLAGFFGGFLLWFVLSLAFGYVAVAAVVNFAREEQFGAAFDFGTITGVVTTGDYAVGWVLGVVVVIVAGAIVGLLNVVPFLGFIIGAFVNFYAIVAAAHLWTGGYADALGLAPAD